LSTSAQSTPPFLDRLYKAYWRELCRFISARYGPGPPDPEDIAQGAFAQLAALERPETLQNPRAFLYRTAQNILIDQRRRMATHRNFVAQAETREVEQPSYDPPADRVLIGREEYDIIEAAIRKMPEKRRQCFLLHRLHGLSYAEIARRLGMSGPGVFKAVEKALAECQSALDESQRHHRKEPEC
jgi:RNA polymerase sigma-70 factor (ECF subfamily)